MNKIAAFTIAALVAIFSYAPANAVPIDYFFWGTGSGTLDGDEFTDQEFHISIWADTDDIHNPGNVPFLDAIMAEIDIGGFATATFTEIVGMFSNNNLGAIGFTSDSRGDLLDIDNSEGT